jgi:hypothetical protein
MLEEPEPESAFGLAGRLGLLDAVLPGWGLSLTQIAAFDRLRDAVPAAERSGVGWAILGAGLHPEAARRLANRFSLPKAAADALLGASELASDAQLADAVPSRIEEVASRYPLAAVRGAALASEDARTTATLDRYLRELRYVEPSVRPGELAALGVPPGPLVGRMAGALRAARLDGVVSTREDELAFVRRALAEWSRKEAKRDD